LTPGGTRANFVLERTQATGGVSLQKRKVTVQRMGELHAPGRKVKGREVSALEKKKDEGLESRERNVVPEE